MKLILLGAPGAGKGTQAAVISERYNIPQISTGNIIREALKSGTEMGLKAKSYMDEGKLVPDEVVIGIIKDRLVQPDCENGFILDGFPRTIPQAEALDKMGVDIDKVIDIEVPDEVIVNRMSGRRVCEKCGRPYHIVNLKPKVEGICDDCTGALIQRKDDQIDTVKARLEIYHKETEPLKGYYEKQNKLYTVEGQNSVEETTALTMKALEA
ncbi:MAG: adenylate kinase [Ruminococcus sp.]|nr:adenylate kinase [Ruminococcus sp.]